MSEMEVFRKGSKTFSLAASFFSPPLRMGAAQVYYWCRHCDDVIDEKKGDYKDLVTDTEAVWDPSQNDLTPPFTALRNAATKFHIPKVYATDLLEGMRMDEEGEEYKTLKDLEKYCYHVASTVGLMMCHVMGLYEEKALKEAASLGVAMQLTNIARDVKDDYNIGRIYLPKNWLEESSIDSNDLLSGEQRDKLFNLVKRLINRSEELYLEGSKGIIHLPLKAALAVTMAMLFYREIGRMILHKGESSLDSRTVVPQFRKIILIFVGLGLILKDLPKRIFANRDLVKIESVWRHE